MGNLIDLIERKNKDPSEKDQIICGVESCGSKNRNSCNGDVHSPNCVIGKSLSEYQKNNQSGGFGMSKTYRSEYRSKVLGGFNMATRREPTPFGKALQLAREITGGKEEQPELYEELWKNLEKVEMFDLPQLFFRLAKEAIRGEISVKGLFPVGKAAKMFSLVHNVAALAHAVREDFLTTEDLVRAGIAEVKSDEMGQKSWIIYRLGLESLKKAVLKLREDGKTNAARIIFNCVQRSVNQKLQAQAKRDARNKKSPIAPRTEEISPAPEGDANATQDQPIPYKYRLSTQTP